MNVLEKLELDIRNDLKSISQINTIDQLSVFCSNIEKHLLFLIKSKTHQYAKALFKNIYKCNSDFIVDTTGNYYSVYLADDLFNHSSITICINLNTQQSGIKDMIQLDLKLKSTGRYNSVSIMFHKNLIESNVYIFDFYKTIFETTYSYFRETISLFIRDSKVCVAKNIYAYIKSLFSNRKLLENFWFAIVGQGYGFRLVDFDLVENAFNIISNSVDNYASYTNKLVSELLGTRLPTEKMLMSIAIKNRQTLIGELNKALYTSEGSIYSTTLYSLYGSGTFVIWPIYIDEFSVLALYPTDIKTEIEETIRPHIHLLKQKIAEEINVLIRAFDLFNGSYTDESTYTNKLSTCIKKILNMLFQAYMCGLPDDIGINISKNFKSHIDYDDNVFNDALISLKNNCYIIECADKTYKIADKGIKFLKENEKMDKRTPNVSNVFNGPVTIHGDVNSNFYNSVDLEEFNKTIRQMIEATQQEDRFTKELILSKINELNLEVHKKSPDKNIIYNILDWLSKISTTASFCITLTSLLGPIIGG